MKVLYPLLVVIILALLPYIGVGVFGFDFLFGAVVPYAAALLFIGGIIYRILKWASSPVPFNIPIVGGQQKSLPFIKASYIDSPSTLLGVVSRMALDILLFRPLFLNERVELKRSGKLIYSPSRYLWLGALVFHWSLFIILTRHLRYFLEPVPSWLIFIENMDSLFFRLLLPGLYVAIHITNITILVALTYLFVRRIIYPQIRYISLPSDYFALLLILGVVLSGVLMPLFYKVHVVGVKELAMGLISFRPVIPEGIGVPFYIHLFLVSVLIAYFPFSKMAHAPGIFFSPTKNLKNISRTVRRVNPWDYPVKVRHYEEYEDEFRERMKKVRLPVEKEK